MNTLGKLFGILAALGTAALLSCDDRGKKEVSFEYKSILEQEFQDTGRSIPLTFEQSIDIDGLFTGDGLYFFYASDRESGNFDIYLRSLTGITTVRLTNHPSKDTMPAVSPDGKYLAFVSTREDPEGDIYVARVKSKKLIEEAEASVSDIPALDEKAKNLTQFQDPQSKTIKIIKDTTPAWSPDNKLIAFCSNRDGRENVWVMKRNGGDLRQITKDGGTSPRFSEDGKLLVFITYRDAGNKGDIYTYNFESGEEKRVIGTPAIELSPCFMRTNDEIVFARIDRDTNGDGTINLKDDSAIVYKNLASGLEFPLTLQSRSSFDPKWSAALNGVIVYSDQTGQNINVNIIPDTGVIPKKETAGSQYELADRYLVEFEDVERYLMCLDNVYNYFGNQTDVDSQVFTAKALASAALKYAETGNGARAQRALQILAAYSTDRSDYRNITARCAAEKMNGRGGADILTAGLGDVSADKTREAYVPYLMEDLADEYARAGRYGDSTLLLQRIIADYGNYSRLANVHYKNGVATYARLEDELAPSYVEVLKSNKGLLVNDTIVNLLSVFDGERNAARRITIATAMLEKYKDVRLLSGMLRFVIGKSLAETGDKSAKATLLDALKSSEKTDLVYYRINLLMSDISEKEKDIEEFEEYLTEAITSYDLQWRQKDIRDVVQRLVDYYEDKGEKAEYDRKYKRAASIYGRYVKLMSALQSKRKFMDIVGQYGARAHVLYIDAYALWKGNKVAPLTELVEKYSGKGLQRARRNFDKAYLYGLGYLYTRLAVAAEKKAKDSVLGTISFTNEAVDQLLSNFKLAIGHLDWALFIDDSYIDAYLLKGWIYQYVDLRRSEGRKETEGANEKLFEDFFPKYLWEKNITIYERALVANRESDNPEQEGNLHLNSANTYFLLNNFPAALQHYLLVNKYKTAFQSKIEEALFHYHFSYSYWQDSQYGKAREEMNKAFNIYQALATGKNFKKYKKQILTMYHYFALLGRIENKYADAINWYQAILSFAGRTKMKIDKARYVQEIAYCYGELGDTAKALQYLGKSRALLKKYKDDEKTYKLRWKVLGLGPISFYNLGPDVAVIGVGGNRIYKKLDTFEKKILNFSMQEEIFFERGDYKKSIGVLKNKLKQLEDRSNKIDRETRIKTLNNIGYGYFKLRNYKAALKYFKEAWDYAAGDDVYDLEGIFESIINIANLNAFLIDESPDTLKNPVKEIDKLVGRITDYKDGYEEMRFKQEYALLKEDAKLRKKKLAPEQVTELRERIKEEATSIYYTIDIAIGVLTFYKAEIIYNAEPPKLKGGSAEDRAYGYYAGNRDLFDLYAAALARFNDAISQAEKDVSKKTMVKLLLNASACQQKMGMMDLAYESLTAAENAAKAGGHTDLEWVVYHETARFLSVYGESVEGKDAAGRAGEYFRSAIGIIEETPPLYSSYFNRIKRLYDEYGELLLKSGNRNTALIISEKKYETLRTVMISLAAPQFRSAKDTEYFTAYMEKVYLIDGLAKQISVLLEAGEQPGTGKLKPLEDGLAMQKRDLGVFKAQLAILNPLLSSMLFGTGGSLVVPEGAVVYKIGTAGGKAIAWRVTGGRTEFKELDGALDDIPAIAGALKQFMSAPENRFVVLDAHSYSLHTALGESGIPFTYIPCIERSRYFMDGPRGSFTSAFYTTKGLKKRLAAGENTKEILVTEGDPGENSLARFSIVVDDDYTENGLDPERLFKEKLGAALLIKDLEELAPDDMNYFTEASLYAGTRSLIFCSRAKPKGLNLIIQQAALSTFDSVAQASALQDYKPLCVGFRGVDKAERDKSSAVAKNAAYDNYQAAFAAGNYKEAMTDLQNWRDLNGDDPEVAIKASLLRAEVELARERGVDALVLAESAMKESENKFPELYLRAAGTRLYCLIREGNPVAAAEILALQKTSVFAESLDYFMYAGILALIEGDSKTGFELIARGKEAKSSYMSSLRLGVLVMEYLSLLGYEDAAKKIAADLTPDFKLSQREICKILLMNGTENPALTDRRSGSVLSLRKEGSINALKSGALLLFEENGEYDMLSPFAATVAIDRMVKAREYGAIDEVADGLDIDDMAQGAFWIDAAQLAFRVCGFYERRQGFEDALEALTKSETAFKSREIAPLKRRYFYELASLLSKLAQHKESYAAAQKGVPYLSAKDSSAFAEYQLLLMDEEIWLGKYSAAEERAAALDPELPDEYSYVKELLRAKMLHATIAAEKAPSDDEWRLLETRISGAFSILDRSARTLHKFNRIELVRENLDFLISRKMDQADHAAALLYAEIKKQLEARSAFFSLADSADIPSGVRDEFKALTDRATGSVRFTELLRERPILHITALAGMIPLEQFQRSIPINTVVFYMLRNGSDILVWAISGTSVEGMRLRGGYDRAAKISENYKADLSSFNNVVGVSKELVELFKPLESYINDKPVLVFVTDTDLEEIPFEVLGDNDVLETAHTVAFLSSIMSGVRVYAPADNVGQYVDAERKSVYQELELVALGQGGIRKKADNSPATGLGHLLPRIVHDPESGDMLIEAKSLQGALKGYGALYLPSADFLGNIGCAEFALYASLQGIRTVFINDAEIHDVNGAIFVSEFYGRLAMGADNRIAFSEAKRSLRSRVKYRYPAYWAGMRVYINSL
ncbi:MAG: hypothetical protein EPN93_01240 [Spirochaetes bacterium]|nr:MAG: hypothetical protein EPN93_01240 [Spirochaetota bacterium]